MTSGLSRSPFSNFLLIWSHKEDYKVGLQLNSCTVILVTMWWGCLWSLRPMTLSYPPVILFKAPQLPQSVLIPEKKNTVPWKLLSQCDIPDVNMAVTTIYVEKAMPKSCMEPLFPEHHPPPAICLSVCVYVCLSSSLSLSACITIISTLELSSFVRFSFICIHLCMCFAPTDSSWNLIPVPSGRRDLREAPNVHCAACSCLSCSHSQES